MKKLNVSILKAQDIMSKEVSVVSPDMKVRDIITLLLDKNLSGCPVVEKSLKRLISVVSEIDLMKIAAMGGLEDPLSKHMDKLSNEKSMVTVLTTDPFALVFKHFITKSIRRIPVVDNGLKVHGIITRRDVVKAILERESVENQQAAMAQAGDSA